MGIWILLLVLIFVPGIIAQLAVSPALNKYSRVRARAGVTGAQAAARIMADAGIHDVQIERINNYLGDHYDPRTKTLALSPAVYGGTSVAALGIAAHKPGTPSSTSTRMRRFRCAWLSCRARCLSRT